MITQYPLASLALLLSCFLPTAIAQGCAIVVGIVSLPFFASLISQAGPETLIIHSTDFAPFSIWWTRSVLDGHTCTGILTLAGNINTGGLVGPEFSTIFIQSTGSASALLTVHLLTPSNLKPNVVRVVFSARLSLQAD
jgi:hypothetical protein